MNGSSNQAFFFRNFYVTLSSTTTRNSFISSDLLIQLWNKNPPPIFAQVTRLAEQMGKYHQNDSSC